MVAGATTKGEVVIAATDGPMAGDYTLTMDFNALCDLETDFPDIMEGKIEFKKPSAIRRLIHAGLLAKHPDMTPVQAGQIIHSIGLGVAAEKLGESMAAAFPDAVKKGKATDPQ